MFGRGFLHIYLWMEDSPMWYLESVMGWSKNPTIQNSEVSPYFTLSWRIYLTMTILVTRFFAILINFFLKSMLGWPKYFKQYINLTTPKSSSSFFSFFPQNFLSKNLFTQESKMCFGYPLSLNIPASFLISKSSENQELHTFLGQKVLWQYLDQSHIV